MSAPLTRRAFLTATTAASSLSFIGTAQAYEMFGLQESNGDFEIMLSEAEWRERLTPKEFVILRKQGTERPNSSPLNKEGRAGTFACKGCELPLYRSETKYDSGTGWPSFTAPIEDAVRVSKDRKLFTVRTEVHCRRCGGHLGHIFNDGPAPTGQRHCLNGLALAFLAD